MEAIGIKVIQICSCSAALHLLSRGLFPCAPTEPSLAVDLNMLELVNELFVRSPPNITGWCDTLEAFLGNRRYKLKTKVNCDLFFLKYPIIHCLVLSRIVFDGDLEMHYIGMQH